MDPAAFFCPISIILAFMIASSRLADANSYSITEICGSNPDIKSARTLSAGIMPRWSTFCQFAWNSKAYASIVLPACLQFLYLRYQVFFLAGEANFCKNACWNPPQLPIQPFTSSYHLAAAPTRYPSIIWKRLYSVHMFASAIRLNLSNHSFGSSVSVPPNSSGLRSCLLWVRILPQYSFQLRHLPVLLRLGLILLGCHLLVVLLGLLVVLLDFLPGFLLRNPLQIHLRILVVDFGYC